MDEIKAKVEEILEKVKGDDSFLAKFKEDPVKALEGLIGKDLPDEQLKGIIEGLKAKLALDKDGDGKLDVVETVEEKAGGLKDKLNLDKDGNGKIDLVENIGEKVGGLGEKLGGLFKKD